MPDAIADRLDLPAQRRDTQLRSAPRFTVSVDAADGIGTGISASDRARTIQLLADPFSRPEDFRRPGHVLGLRAARGGVLKHAGHTEAAVELTRLAGLQPVGVVADVAGNRRPADAGSGTGLTGVCGEHALAVVSIEDLADQVAFIRPRVERVVEARVPLAAGQFTAVGFRDPLTGAEHVAFVLGEVNASSPVPVHVHTECVLGDAFGALTCRCAGGLAAALRSTERAGRGIVLYLRHDRGGVLDELRRVSGVAATDRLPDDDAQIIDAIMADLGVRGYRSSGITPSAKRAAKHGFLLSL